MTLFFYQTQTPKQQTSHIIENHTTPSLELHYNYSRQESKNCHEASGIAMFTAASCQYKTR